MAGGGITNYLSGGHGIDRVIGSRGYDILVGGKGDDHSRARRGEDFLYDGRGDDQADGRGGLDRCRETEAEVDCER